MERLAELAREFGVILNGEQVRQFQEYYHLLLEKNKVMNLTAITGKEEVLWKHFLDSLSVCCAAPFRDSMETCRACRILDLGTGAGFPGIPLKIAFPDVELVLADALKKRISFLDELIASLGLNHISTIHGRAEELGRREEYRETFHFCVSRAVANLAVLAEYCLPFVKPGGYFISYKSAEAQKEIEESQRAVFVLGGRIEKSPVFFLPQSDIARCLVVIKKVKPIGRKYPRSAGKPSKDPIH